MNFVKGLLTNRFGIILATLNVCCLVFNYDNFMCGQTISGKAILCINIPAIILAKITSDIPYIFFQSVPYHSFIQIAFLFLPIFVLIQWLFIAHLARVIAQKLSKSSL